MKLKPIIQKTWMVIVMLCLSVSASAYDFTVDGIYYNITDAEQQKVEVTNKSTNHSSYQGDVKIPFEVEYNSKTYSVASIGSYAFSGCSSLTSVIIPNTVTSIESYAFRGCSGLTSVVIPPLVSSIGQSAFEGCKGIKKFAYPEGLPSPIRGIIDLLMTYKPTKAVVEDGFIFGIEKSSIAFVPNTLEGEYTIPNSVTLIESCAFLKCSGLTSVVIPNSVTWIGTSAFSECKGLTSVVIPNSVTWIGNCAFSDCSGLTSVVIPNSVTWIGNSAFSDCSGLTSVIIPNSVTSIGNFAFSGCSGLKKSAYPIGIAKPFSSGIVVAYEPTGAIVEDGFVFGPEKSSILFVPYTLEGKYTIPNSVTSIGSYAFSGCSGLTSIIVPNSVTSIGDSAFSGCTGLKKSAYPKGLTTPFSGIAVAYEPTGAIVEDEFIFGPGKSSILFAPYTIESEYIIPNSVTSIGGSAFEGCNSLTSVMMPNSVTSIGSYAFKGCSSLTSVIMPNSVASIGGCAFEGCNSLTSVSIPYSVTTIEGSTFSDCSSLASVIIPNSVATIKGAAFGRCSNLTSVVIPNSVYSIASNAFSGCSGLKKSAYPNGIANPFDTGIAVAYEPTGAIVEDGFVFGPDKSSILFAPIAWEGEYTISNSVTKIGEYAFSSCMGLTSVVIPNSVTSIEGFAFNGCSGLTSVNLPNSVTSIGDSAFSGCSGLSSIVIPNSVTSIGNSAFSGCSGLKKSAYPIGIAKPFSSGIVVAYEPTGAIVEDDFVFGPEKSSILFAPYTLEGEYVIPNSVTSIGSNAFNICRSLTSVVIPNSVTSIESEAFRSCSGLTSVVIPNSVTSIGSYAFLDCDGLKKSAYPKRIRNPFYSGIVVSYEPIGAIVEDGFVFGPDKSSILFAPYSLTGEYTIPNSVTSIGVVAFKGCSSLTSVTMPNSVTLIGESAFEGCNILTSVNLPNSVTSIGGSAFKGCYSLKSVIIPNLVTSIGDSAFSGCSSLKKSAYPEQFTNPFKTGVIVAYNPTGAIVEDGVVFGSEKSSLLFVPYDLEGEYVIPNSVTSIGSNAFNRCRSLTSVVIPNSVTSIGTYAFKECEGLRSAEIPNSVTSIGKYAFSGSGLRSVEIPNSITSIEEYTFSNCSLTSVEIPNSITSIKGYAFFGCSALTSVEIPNSLTCIGESAFAGCSDLNSINISNSVTVIGSYAFANCYGLSSVVIPNSVTLIGAYAFTNCSGLQQLTLEDGDSSLVLEVGAFYNVYRTSIKNAYIGRNWTYSDNSSIFSSKITEVTIGAKVTSLPNYAFSDCSGLTSVVIPNSVTWIGSNAFSGCSGLQHLTLEDGDSALAFGLEVFSNAPIQNAFIGRNWTYSRNGSIFDPKITEVTLGDRVTKLPNNAFKGCSLIKAVTTYSTEPPLFSEDAFSGLYEKATLSIPKNSLNAYLGSNWALFKSLKIADSEQLIKNYSDGVLDYYLLAAERETENNVAIVRHGNYESLTTVTIPERCTSEDSQRYYVTGISFGAFRDCKQLKEVNFHSRNTITSIGEEAFQETAISTIMLPKTVTSIGKKAFKNSSLSSFIIPEEVIEIADETFIGCKNLSSIDIPAWVESIGKSAFAYCENLHKLTILKADSVLVVDTDAFTASGVSQLDINRNWTSLDVKSICTGINSVKIGTQVNSLPAYAFSGCSNLMSCVIPNSVTSIGACAFKKCEGLRSVEIPNSVTSIGEYAFSNCGLTSVEIPNSVTSIGSDAFSGCSSLAAVSFGSGVTAIPNNAFANCKLSKLVLPPAVETVGSSAFADNQYLKEVAMGKNIKSISDLAFDQAPIEKVFITTPEPPTAPNSAFSRYAAKLYVQGNAAVDAYYDALTCWDRFEGYAMSEPQSLTMEKPTTVEGKAGKRFTLKATLTPANVDLPYVFWRSTDPKKAYVDNDGNVTVLQDITDEDNLEIIAETLYHNGPVATFSFYAGSTGVDEIVGDTTATMDVFTLQGVQVLHNATREQFENLARGIYIVKNGKNVKKVVK